MKILAKRANSKWIGKKLPVAVITGPSSGRRAKRASVVNRDGIRIQ